MKFFLYILISICVIISLNVKAQSFTYDFSTGYENWSGDFADYPITDSLFYELSFDRAKLPAPLDTNKFSLRISGNNHSDDLFMFIKRKVSGLLPNTTYKLLISIDVASKYPTNAAGVGGAPGEGVFMKAGATTTEPKKIISGGNFYIMNIDKDNQSNPGMDMDTIGNVSVEDTTTVYTIINRNNSSNLFKITSDANGEVWVCIGTDSGFEATTTLYYSQVKLIFSNVTGIEDGKTTPEQFSLLQNYPNPFNPSTKIEYEIPVGDFVTLKVFDILGKEIATLINNYQNAGKYKVAFNGRDLSNGMYIYQITVGNFSFSRKMILLK